VNVLSRASRASQDVKTVVRLDWRRLHVKQSSARGRWRGYQQILAKYSQSLRIALGVNFDRAADIAYPAAEIVAVGETKDKWPEADALHAPADPPALRRERQTRG
jgi:hypothetical protein